MVNSTTSDLPPAYNTLTLSTEQLTINNIMADPHNDVPKPTAPTYSTLDLRIINTAEEVVIDPDIAQVTETLIGTSFEDKNAWVIFTLKVLCIFILQSISVGVVLGIFVHYQIVMKHIFLICVAAAMIYLIAIIAMARIYQAKSRKKFNYLMLVFCPLSATFIMVMVPTLFDMHLQSKLQQAFLFSWMILILAESTLLFLGIFSLDCKHEFTFMTKCIITASVFSISSFGVYISLYMDNSDFDFISSAFLTVFLYVYFLYILYDIDAMTSGHYRSPLTTADYVTGAVNMHIDFLFIITDFIKKKCYCGNEQ